jgi:predicted nucleotidyltransferase component of viral defense system
MENQMNLHEAPHIFKDAIIATAKEFKINELFIEKNYWITFILKSISNSKFENKIVFKGGTSLSKEFHLINRFSEDIDIALLDINDLTENQIKKLIKTIESNIIISPLYELPNHPQMSKGSRIRKSVYQLPTVFDNYPFSPTIILEINSFSTPKPYEQLELSSLIYDFLKNRNKNILEEFNLKPFKLNILSYKRTFCEKISALTRASFDGDNALKNKIRHLYDIYKLLQLTEISNFIQTEEFINLLIEVKSDDLKQRGFSEIWKKEKFSEGLTLVFDKLNKLEKTFNHQMSSLLFEELPDFSDVLQKISELIKILKAKKV